MVPRVRVMFPARSWTGVWPETSWAGSRSPPSKTASAVRWPGSQNGKRWAPAQRNRSSAGWRTRSAARPSPGG